jgi:hypothetical protein
MHLHLASHSLDVIKSVVGVNIKKNAQENTPSLLLPIYLEERNAV